MQMSFGSNKESQADYALKQVFDNFGIPYVLQARQRTQGRPSLTAALMGAMGVTSQMPLLTVQGFTELCKIDALSNPEKACRDLNTILRQYQLSILRERGEVPRWALPSGPVASMTGRIAQAQANMQASMAAQSQNLMANAQSMDQSRFSANQIGQDSNYVYRYEYR
jgi:hypothetical protein